MTHRKSSQFQSLRMQSELQQPSELRREIKRNLSSADELASHMGTGVRSEFGTVAAVGEEDPAANLFPVRTRNPLSNVIKGLRTGRHPWCVY